MLIVDSPVRKAVKERLSGTSFFDKDEYLDWVDNLTHVAIVEGIDVSDPKAMNDLYDRMWEELEELAR